MDSTLIRKYVTRLFNKGWTRCIWCGEELSLSAKGHLNITKEHLVPRAIAKGAPNNIALAHAICNTVRGKRLDISPHPEVYQAMLENGLIIGWKPEEPAYSIVDKIPEAINKHLRKKELRKLKKQEARQAILKPLRPKEKYLSWTRTPEHLVKGEKE